MTDAAPPRLPAVPRAILALAATGRSSPEIAADLRLGAPDVHDHLAAAMGTLGARSKLEAVVIALRLRLVLVPSALQCDLLEALATGEALVGTIPTLARSLQVGAHDFRAGLRGLLEVQLIAVYSSARGQLVIRLERRIARALPLSPPTERRRPVPRILPF